MLMFSVEVWIRETDKLWSRSTEIPSLLVSWTAQMAGESERERNIYHSCFQCSNVWSGSCWKASPTTPWMWWTVWWSDEGTRCRATHSRGAFPTFTTKMTSEEQSVSVWCSCVCRGAALCLEMWSLRCQYCINIGSPQSPPLKHNLKV